jgi:hypothetical protein
VGAALKPIFNSTFFPGYGVTRGNWELEPVLNDHDRFQRRDYNNRRRGIVKIKNDVQNKSKR